MDCLCSNIPPTSQILHRIQNYSIQFIVSIFLKEFCIQSHNITRHLWFCPEWHICFAPSTIWRHLKRENVKIIQINHTDITFITWSHFKNTVPPISTNYHLHLKIANYFWAERCFFQLYNIKKSLKPENYFPLFTWAGAILSVDTVSRSTSSLFSWKKTLQL